MNRTLLWLDDLRNPTDNIWNNWIARKGVNPMSCDMTKTQDKKLKKLETKSGFECAKWMVNYCMDNDLHLPDWYIQSANPVGAENIKSYLQSFAKSYQ
jgi:hypothetical protein